MTPNQESVVRYAIERGMKGKDFADTWYSYLLKFERAYFADIHEYLFFCALEMEKAA